MVSTTTSQTTSNRVLRYNITGARRLSNYFFAVIIAIGAIGFLLAGLSSFFHVNLLPIADANPSELIFIPQGLALTFYGIAGTLLDTYLCWIMSLNLGGGYNEFNLETGKVTIFRSGYPGKNREIKFDYAIADVMAVRAEVKNGLNPKRLLYLRVKGRGDLPLTEVGQPMALATLEDQAAELARFLSVPLEGL